MCSPRSVSTTSAPSRSSAAVSSISSVTIDLLFTTSRPPCSRTIRPMWATASPAVEAKNTRAPLASAASANRSRYSGRLAMVWARMARAVWRKASKSASPNACCRVSARTSIACPMAEPRPGVASRARARSRKVLKHPPRRLSWRGRRPQSASRGEQEGEVHRTGAASPRGAAVEVHEAPRVAADEHVGPDRTGSGELVVGHGRGELGQPDREGPAEPAAGIRPLHLHEPQPLDPREEPPALVTEPQPPKAVAGVVVGNGGGEHAGDSFHPQHVHEELGQLERLRGELPRPVRLSRALEEPRQVQADHRRAGSRGGDHRR